LEIKMIKCPNPECGHENVDGTQFCEGCGEELTQGAAASAGAADAATGSEIKCPACDNMNPPGNDICEVCVADLGTGTDAVPAPPIAAATSTPTVAPVSSAPPSSAAPATDDTAAVAAAPVSAPITSPDTPTIATAPATTALADDVVATSTAAPATAAPVSPAAPASTAVATPAAGANLQPGRVKLTVEQGMSVGAQFVLGDAELLVGREDEEEQIYPDIDLSDQDAGFVHRRHASLKFENGVLTVTHLGGTNKTRVNNKPIPDNVPQPVNLGDKIAFGKVVLRVLPV
jgi:hypothetical protein